MPEYNHNKTNSYSYKEYIERKKSLNAQSKIETKIAQIKTNIETWERDYTKIKNIKLNKDFVKEVQQAYPIRAALFYKDPKENLMIGYKIAKACVALGLRPNSICITNLNECYSTIRGFGEQSKIKNKIFNEDTKLLIIEQVRPNRPTDVQDNVTSFINELSASLMTRDNLGIIFIGDSDDSINFASSKTNLNWKMLEQTNIEIYKDNKAKKSSIQKKLGRRLKIK